MLGAAGVVLGLVLAAFIREPERDEAERRESGAAPPTSPSSRPFRLGEFLRGLVATPSVLLLILAFLGANSVGMVFLTWMPTFLNEKFELSLAQAGVSATIYLQVGSMVGSMLGGVMADWLAQAHARRTDVRASPGRAVRRAVRFSVRHHART